MCTSWVGPGQRSPPSREIECSLCEANRPGSGSSWLARASRSCRPPASKRKTCFRPSPLCFPPTKGRVSVGAGLRSVAGRAGRSVCQIRPGGLARGSKGSDLPPLPRFLPGHSFALSPFSSQVPAHFQAEAGPHCQGEQRPCSGFSRDRWDGARLRASEKKGNKKAVRQSLQVQKPEGCGMVAFGVRKGPMRPPGENSANR